MRKKRRGTPPATETIPLAQQWANEQNAHWTPPPSPAAPEPPARIDSEEDRRDLRDEVRCMLSGGPFDGRATSSRPTDWSQERGYASRLLYLDGIGLARREGDSIINSSDVYIWTHRRPDGVHVYEFGCREWKSDAP
jgi:hypothetical protein